MQQATAPTTILFFAFILCAQTLTASTPPLSNDECAGATSLTLGVTNTNGTVKGATASSGIPAPCLGTPDDDVWYTFALSSTQSITVTLSNLGSNLSSSGAIVQLLSGTCTPTPSFSSLACGTTSVSYASLTSGTYYVRVFSAGSSSLNSGATFDITVTGPPANDDCAGATTLTSATSCSNIAGSIANAAASTGLPSGCESAGTHYDAWYKFTAVNGIETITISSLGSNFTNPEIQLYSGTSCGSLNSIQCAPTGTTTLTATNLTSGSLYYVRISNIGISPSANGDFNICVTNPAPPVTVTAGRMNEVYKQTILSGAGALQYPWEVTYGPDGNLWITESRGYKVYKMNPTTGTKATALDISFGSTSTELTSAEHTTFNVQFNNAGNVAGCGCWPQGGLAGLAIHPLFNSGKPYVYVSYVRKFDSTSSTTNGGVYFKNSVVRFTYNSSTQKLESPVAICDTLPGSSDHNSQRIIVAPVGGTYYLFYAQGDMGAGQFSNQFRPNRAQNQNSYEGKILRFNLEADADAGSYDQWIPNDNPYNGVKQSAVWCIGIRNNQGFAYDTTLNILYGASHGPYSDDEINIIEQSRNYGHPLIEGFASDGNCNGTTAGTAPNMSGGASGSSCPAISNEAAAAATIGASYKDPLFSGYPNSIAYPSILNLWNTTTGANANWPTEAWSGLDLYKNTLVPGWKNSLVAASLKWGRLVRLKLGAAGATTAPTNSVADTISYFNCQNRFRDLAFSPDGKDIYVIMDNSSTTSGPGNLNPVVPQCAGCVQKYTFLGYADVSGKSSIPASIDVTAGSPNACSTGTTVTIDNENSNYWVPITGPDGNIMAEIYANGNNLGTVTSSFYTNSGAIRTKNGTHYLNRNITITPQFQPSSTVKIRLYMSKAEFDSLDADPLGGVTTITDLKILKNTDPCSSGLTNATTLITPTYAEAHGTAGYMVQGNIGSFSSFYFASSNITLAQQLLTFTGSLQNQATYLKWETANEINASNYILERSVDGLAFNEITTVQAKGNSSNSYSYIDYNATNLMSSVVYYRLKMVDVSGSFTYSKVVTVTFSSSYTVFIYPNPMRDVLKIKLSLPRAQNLQINVTDVKGHVVYRKSKMAGAGTSEFEINAKNWPSQMYSIKIVGNNQEVLAVRNVVKL